MQDHDGAGIEVQWLRAGPVSRLSPTGGTTGTQSCTLTTNNESRTCCAEAPSVRSSPYYPSRLSFLVPARDWIA